MSSAAILVASDAVVCLPDGAVAELVDRLRAAVVGNHPVSEIVGALAASGVATLPSLAIAVRGDDRTVRTFVRGTGQVRVVRRDGRIDAVRARDDVTTWQEDVFSDVESAVLGTHDGQSFEVEFVVSRDLRVGDQMAAAPPAVGLPAEVRERGRDEPSLTVDDRTPLPEGEHTLLPEAVGPSPAASADETASGQALLTSEEDQAVHHDDDQTVHRPAAAESRTVSAPVDEAGLSPAPSHGLIASVPPAGGGGQSVSTPTPDSAQRLVEEALPRREPDEDDQTIAASEHRRLLQDLKPPLTEDRLPGSVVQAVLCTAGHPNPPQMPQCRGCGARIDDRIVRDVMRPSLGRLRLSSGQVVELDRPQLLGRRPTVGDDVAPTDLPGIVSISDPEQSLSRVHAEVRLQGWDVYLVDCGSRNGTIVQLPGHEPTRLRAGDPCLIVPGTRVSLADVVDFHFEVGQS